jgi:hypothetical protein
MPLLGRPANIELVRVLPHGLVTVTGPVKHDHEVTLVDPDAVEVERLRGSATEMQYGGYPPEQLLCRAPD